jgi:adenylate kinase
MRIALSGKRGSGKSTVASYLSRVYGIDTVSFADLLKDRLEEAGIRRDSLRRTKPPLVRELMQVYGQAMREQDEDYWVNRALLTIEASGLDDVVIDDLRFRNEAVALKENGFILVRVVQDGREYNDRLDSDPSEIDLDDWDDWDYIVSAPEGDLMGLFGQVDEIIARNGG